METYRRFGRYPANHFMNQGGLRTAKQCYEEGYETGRTWTRDYRPGGPHVTHIGYNHREDADWVAFCNATKENNEEYLRGFDDARAGRESNWESDVASIAELGYN